MRTTIRLPDELYDQVRISAATEGRTITSFLEQALRAELRRQAQPPVRERYVVEPFEGEGLRAGVDLDDNAELLAVMDADAGD